MKSSSKVGSAGARALSAKFPQLYAKHRTEVRRVEKCCGGYDAPPAAPAEIAPLSEEVGALVAQFATVGADIDGSASDEQLGKITRLIRLLDKIGDAGWRLRDAAHAATVRIAEELGQEAPYVEEPAAAKSLLRRSVRKGLGGSMSATVEKANRAAAETLGFLEDAVKAANSGGVDDVDDAVEWLQSTERYVDLSKEEITTLAEALVNDDGKPAAAKSLLKRRVRKARSSSRASRALEDASTAADRLTERLQSVLDLDAAEIASDGDASDAQDFLTVVDEVVTVAVKQVDEVRDRLQEVEDLEVNQADI